MRYKLIVPWTARLPISRWMRRRNSAFEAALKKYGTPPQQPLAQ